MWNSLGEKIGSWIFFFFFFWGGREICLKKSLIQRKNSLHFDYDNGTFESKFVVSHEILVCTLEFLLFFMQVYVSIFCNCPFVRIFLTLV